MAWQGQGGAGSDETAVALDAEGGREMGFRRREAERAATDIVGTGCGSPQEVVNGIYGGSDDGLTAKDGTARQPACRCGRDGHRRHRFLHRELHGRRG